MFADDKSIENFQQLFFEFKKYLELQKEYTKLELTEKLTILLSTLIMIVVLIILGMVALFYLLFALAYVLEPLVGGLMVSFAIIAGINYGFSHYFPQAAYHLSHGKLPRQLIFKRFKII
mgnify:CR=1 FL=1